MNKSTKAGFVALAAVCAAVASAQTNGPSGISGRLGVGFPNTGDSKFAAGLDYKFKGITVDEARPGYETFLGASVDYFGDDRDYSVPIALTYNIRANQAVFGAGIGATFYKFSGSGSQTAFGAQASATYEFARSGATNSNPFFVQAKYFFNFDESDASFFGIYAGYRF
jgi:hypothetical protein